MIIRITQAQHGQVVYLGSFKGVSGSYKAGLESLEWILRRTRFYMAASVY